jgi:flagellar biosynthetic protein FliR
MRAEELLSASTLIGFLLTLVRVSGVFVFVPIPGTTATLSPIRIILALGITIALFPLWPKVAEDPSIGLLVLWTMSEAALGIGIGLAVGFVAEAFALGAQVLGLQAGYSFASTIEPGTQADSTVIVVFSQLAAGLLFFATGLDRDVLRIFARSLEFYPPGSFALSRGAAEQILMLGSTIFSTGLRLGLPVVAVLVMVDISLALLGRVNSQLQLLHLAFPVKMILGLAMLGWIAILMPPLYRAGAESAFAVARGLIAR